MVASLLVALMLSGQAALAADTLELELVPDESTLAAEVDATAHGFEAKVTQFTGSLSFDRETGLPTDARLSFDFKNVTTGNDSRDRDMLRWLDYEKFPTAEVQLVSVDKIQDGDGIRARCTLRIHGQEKEVTMDTSVSREEDGGWLVEGEGEIDHRDWGLPKITRMFFLTVDPVMRVHFRLRFRGAEG